MGICPNNLGGTPRQTYKGASLLITLEIFVDALNLVFVGTVASLFKLYLFKGLPSLATGITLASLSDLTLPSWFRQLLNKIYAINPAIFSTGGLVPTESFCAISPNPIPVDGTPTYDEVYGAMLGLPANMAQLTDKLAPIIYSALWEKYCICRAFEQELPPEPPYPPLEPCPNCTEREFTEFRIFVDGALHRYLSLSTPNYLDSLGLLLGAELTNFYTTANAELKVQIWQEQYKNNNTFSGLPSWDGSFKGFLVSDGMCYAQGVYFNYYTGSFYGTPTIELLDGGWVSIPRRTPERNVIITTIDGTPIDLPNYQFGIPPCDQKVNTAECQGLGENGTPNIDIPDIEGFLPCPAAPTVYAEDFTTELLEVQEEEFRLLGLDFSKLTDAEKALYDAYQADKGLFPEDCPMPPETEQIQLEILGQKIDIEVIKEE